MLWITALSCISVSADGNWSRLRLTYDKPAAESTDGVPVGEGSVDATVFGSANEDRI